jgi:hypothetical protein
MSSHRILSALSILLVALGAGASAVAMDEPSASTGTCSSSSSSSSSTGGHELDLAESVRWDIEHSAMLLGVDEGLILGDLLEVQMPVYTPLIARGITSTLDHQGRALVGPRSRVGTGTLAPHPEGLVILQVGRSYTVARPAREDEDAQMATAEGVGYVPITRSAVDDLGRPTELEIIPADGHCLISTLIYLKLGSLPDADRIRQLRAEAAARMPSPRLAERGDELLRETIREVRPLLDNCHSGLGPAVSRYLASHSLFQDAYSAALAKGVAAQETAPGAFRAPAPGPVSFGGAGSRRGGRSGAPSLGPQGFRFMGDGWSWSLVNGEDGQSSMEIDINGVRAQVAASSRGIQSVLLVTREGNVKSYHPSRDAAAEWLTEFNQAVQFRAPEVRERFQEQMEAQADDLILHHVVGLTPYGTQRERAGLVLGYWDAARAACGLDSPDRLLGFLEGYRNAGSTAPTVGDSASGRASTGESHGGQDAHMVRSRTTFDLASLLGARTGQDLGRFSLGRPATLPGWPRCLVATNTPGSGSQHLMLLDDSGDAILRNPLLGACDLVGPQWGMAWVHQELALVAAGASIALYTVGLDQELRLHGHLPPPFPGGCDLAVSPVNRALMLVADGSNLHYVDLEHPATYQRLPMGAANLSSVSWPAWSNGGVCPSVTAENGTFGIWDSRMLPLGDPAFGVALGKTGLSSHVRTSDFTVFLGFDSGTIQLVDIRVTDRSIGRVEGSRTLPVSFMDYDRERNTLLIGGPGSWATFGADLSGRPLVLECAGPTPGTASVQPMVGRSGWILDASSDGLLGITQLAPGASTGSGESKR